MIVNIIFYYKIIIFSRLKYKRGSYAYFLKHSLEMHQIPFPGCLVDFDGEFNFGVFHDPGLRVDGYAHQWRLEPR